MSKVRHEARDNLPMTSSVPEIDLAALQALGALPQEERLSVSNGEDLEDVRRRQAMSEKAYAAGESFENLPPETWPRIERIHWDLQRQSQRFSMDGVTAADFDRSYPGGFVLGHVDLEIFDRRLCHHSRRDGNELWEVGNRRKLVKALGWIILGYPISPPLAAPTGRDEVIFHGGHHRYAVAKAYGMSDIPIYVKPGHVAELQDRVSVRWAVSPPPQHATAGAPTI
jgi:hypothetical protein